LTGGRPRAAAASLSSKGGVHECRDSPQRQQRTDEGAQMHSTARNIDQHNQTKPAAIDVFRARAEAKYLLIANGYQDLQSAVDELWAAAERDGLVDKFGVDAIQWILSEAFGRRRLANE
jgi:hypothetical protein